MDILAIAVSAAITGLSVFIASWIMFTMQQQRLIAWLLSADGIEDLATIGAAIAAGAMTQMKVGHAAGGIKLGPIRIPQALVDAAITRFLGPFLKQQPEGMIPQG